MNEINLVAIIVAANVVIIFSLLSVSVVWLFFRNKKKDKQAVKSLVKALNTREHTRRKKIKELLKKMYQLEPGDTLEKSADVFMEEEKTFYQQFVDVYMLRDPHKLKNFFEHADHFLSTFCQFEREVEQLDHESADPGQDNESLQAECMQLGDELMQTRSVLNNLFVVLDRQHKLNLGDPQQMALKEITELCKHLTGDSQSEVAEPQQTPHDSAEPEKVAGVTEAKEVTEVANVVDKSGLDEVSSSDLEQSEADAEGHVVGAEPASAVDVEQTRAEDVEPVSEAVPEIAEISEPLEQSLPATDPVAVVSEVVEPAADPQLEPIQAVDSASESDPMVAELEQASTEAVGGDTETTSDDTYTDADGDALAAELMAAVGAQFPTTDEKDSKAS